VFELVLGTLIVCCIYVLANLMYLAVVPLQDIATTPADRVGVVASQYILVG
jgi:APA family basic amino acid/polyamine antiporter